MEKTASFAEVLEAADQLPLDEQELLADVLHRRVVEERRKRLVGEVREAREEYEKGQVRPTSLNELSEDKMRVRGLLTDELGIEQIERAITELPARDLAELMSWFWEYHAQVWDDRIKEDLEAGHLDALLAEVDEEYEAGLTQPL